MPFNAEPLWGWYDTEGNLRGAAAKLKAELEGFHKRCPDKPMMLGEYGADTIAGLHDINARLFTEEYQTAFMKAYGGVLILFLILRENMCGCLLILQQRKTSNG